MYILFLEDEKDLSWIGTTELRSQGHTVFAAATIAEAVTILQEQRTKLNLIIADHRLPDGEGIDFVMAAREALPKVKAAVVSGVLKPSEREFLRCQDIPFFIKPILYRQVVQHFRKPPPGVTVIADSSMASAPTLSLRTPRG